MDAEVEVDVEAELDAEFAVDVDAVTQFSSNLKNLLLIYVCRCAVSAFFLKISHVHDKKKSS